MENRLVTLWRSFFNVTLSLLCIYTLFMAGSPFWFASSVGLIISLIMTFGQELIKKLNEIIELMKGDY